MEHRVSIILGIDGDHGAVKECLNRTLVFLLYRTSCGLMIIVTVEKKLQGECISGSSFCLQALLQLNMGLNLVHAWYIQKHLGNGKGSISNSLFEKILKSQLPQFVMCRVRFKTCFDAIDQHLTCALTSILDSIEQRTSFKRIFCVDQRSGRRLGNNLNRIIFHKTSSSIARPSRLVKSNVSDPIFLPRA